MCRFSTTNVKTQCSINIFDLQLSDIDHEMPALCMAHFKSGLTITY